MNTDKVILDIKKNIGLITINREEKLNALNLEIDKAIYEALKEILTDKKIRTIIITGKGRAFSVGGDLDAFQEENFDKIEILFKTGRKMYQLMESFPKPIITAVNGITSAGGMLFILYSDIVLASDRASFSIPEVKLGILPLYKIIKKLSLAIGTHRAKELLMTGKTIDSVTAERIGLVNKVFPHTYLMKEALKLAHEIADNSPLSLSFIKDAMNKSLYMSEQELIEYEDKRFKEEWYSEDKKEGVKSFIERSKPTFKNMHFPNYE